MTIMIPVVEDSANPNPQGAVAFKHIRGNGQIAIQIEDRTITVSADEFLSAAGALAGKGI